MLRYLVCVGLQKEKLALCGSKGKKILDWVKANQDKYDGTISIIRKDLARDNFNRMNDSIANNRIDFFDYDAGDVIAVPGFVVDASKFRKDIIYDIVGISTGASVLGVAYSMFAAGLEIHVLEKYCTDRKGVHDQAIKIMKSYMPIVF